MGSVEIMGTDAKHSGTRHPLAARTPSLGYIVSGSHSLYFAGDTGFFSAIADIWPERLDVALLPIAGIGPRMPEFKHMSPRTPSRPWPCCGRASFPHPLGHVPPARHGAVPLRPRLHRRAPFLFMAQAADLEPDVHTVLLRPARRCP